MGDKLQEKTQHNTLKCSDNKSLQNSSTAPCPRFSKSLSIHTHIPSFGVLMIVQFCRDLVTEASVGSIFTYYVVILFVLSPVCISSFTILYLCRPIILIYIHYLCVYMCLYITLLFSFIYFKCYQILTFDYLLSSVHVAWRDFKLFFS